MKVLRNLFQRSISKSQVCSSDSLLTSLFSQSEYEQFIQTVHSYFREQSLEFSIENGSVFLPHQERHVSLHNLAQICHQNNRNTWKTIIHDHFVQLDKIFIQSSGPFQIGTSFAEVAPNLAIRIWSIGTLEATGRENCIFREDLWDTVSVLVLDLADTIQTISPGSVSHWGKPVEDLFAIGLRNVLKKCKPEI